MYLQSTLQEKLDMLSLTSNIYGVLVKLEKRSSFLNVLSYMMYACMVIIDWLGAHACYTDVRTNMH